MRDTMMQYQEHTENNEIRMGISRVLDLSLTSLHERRLNKVHAPLLAEDMTHLRNYIIEKIVNESRRLKGDLTAKRWSLQAKLLLAKAVMLNKKRGSEASKLLLTSYKNRPNWTQSSFTEIMTSNSSREQSKRYFI